MPRQVKVLSKQEILWEVAAGMGSIFPGQKSHGLLAVAVLCAPLPEGIPVSVGTNAPEHDNWVDVLRMPARARALQLLLGHVAVGVLNLSRADGPAVLDVRCIMHRG